MLRTDPGLVLSSLVRGAPQDIALALSWLVLLAAHACAGRGDRVPKQPHTLTMRLRHLRRDRSLLAASFLLLLAATTIVPYRFPPTNEVMGSSFEVGYNNQIAYVVFVATVVIAAVFAARLLPLSNLVSLAWRETLSTGISWRLYLTVSAAHVLLFAALYVYKGRFAFSEGNYFQELLHRMTLGELPYVDFSYYYGPSMLYPAYLMIRAFVSLEAAYAISYVLTYVGGLLLLYLLLTAFLASGRTAGMWFVFLSVGLFNPLEGLNFTFVRYLLPSVALLLFLRYVATGGAKRFVALSLLLCFTFLYSQEVGALTLVGTVAVLVVAAARAPVYALFGSAGRMLSLRTDLTSEPARAERSRLEPGVVLRRGVTVLGSGFGLALAGLWSIDPSGRALLEYPYSFVVRLTGEHNAPVYPHLPFIVISALTVFAAAGWLRLTAEGARSKSISPFLTAYLPVALLAERAVIALSEPTHVVFFGLPVLLIALHVVCRLRLGRGAQRAIAAAVVFGFMIPLQLLQLSLFVGFFHSSAAVAAPPTSAPLAATTPSHSFEATLTEIVRRGGFDRPYYMYKLDYYSMPIYHQLGLRYPSYDTDLNSVTTPPLVDRLVEQVRATNALVIIARSDLDQATGVERRDPAWNVLALATGAALPGSDLAAATARSISRVESRFLDFLRSEYRPIYELNGLLLLSR